MDIISNKILKVQIEEKFIYKWIKNIKRVNE